jgi:hypothetical protein
MSNYGYIFYFQTSSGLLTFPITPGELTIKTGSNNKVVSLINEGDINILKSPSLTEVEFTARFPMRKYPYSRQASDFETYLTVFNELKEDKESFRFIVARTTPTGKKTWDTNLLVALEDVEVNEDADEGDDVLVTFSLKEYKHYGVVRLVSAKAKPKTTSTSNKPRDDGNKAAKPKDYVVQKGDCLWNIAKAKYGDGSLWTKIYEANKTKINDVAKSRGLGDSSNGHWIFEGTELVIPAK